MTAGETALETSDSTFATEVSRATDESHRLAGLFAIPEGEDFLIVAVIAGGPAPTTIVTRLRAGRSNYPSVTALVPAADWYEREMHDLFGIVADGHPDLVPLVFPRAPGSPAPRPGATALGETVRLTPSDVALPALVHGEGVFTIPYGPVRSGVFEAIEYVVESPGEDIPRLQTRVHYKHRGVRAAFAGRGQADGALVAERVEGVATVAHALAYAHAIEAISGAQVSPDAELVRVLHAELERIANHLESTLRHTEAAAQAVAYARLTSAKEQVMRLRAKLCGSRFGRGVVVPGGVTRAPMLGADELSSAVATIARDVRSDIARLMSTPSFLDRLRNTGAIPHRVAARYGALGPLGRGSGVAEDVRASRPYGGYRHLAVRPATRPSGDALARQLVRNEEMATSFHLIDTVVAELGGARADASWSVPATPASGQAFGWAEAPQGEVLYYVEACEGVLAHVVARSASFHNLGLFTAAFPRDITTDFGFIEASFGLSVAGAAT